MPIVFGTETAQFLDVCTVDEALDLIEWLRGRSDPEVDLESCTHLHTSLFQLILATQPKIKELPDNLFLRRCFSDARSPLSLNPIFAEETHENQDDSIGG